MRKAIILGAALVLAVVAVVSLAGCGGGSSGWTDAQRDAYILDEYKDGRTLAQAECKAAFYEKKFPNLDEMETKFADMTFDEMFADETMGEMLAVSLMADAQCGIDDPLFDE